MRKTVYITIATLILITSGLLLYDHFMLTKSEIKHIALKYASSQSLDWKVSTMTSLKNEWIVLLTPAEPNIKEAIWLYIDTNTGKIIKQVQTE